MKLLIHIILLFIFSTPIFSQGVTIKGVITDQNGNYLQDVNIREKKTSRGTITNGNGNYMLSLPFQKKYIITFSHINHIEQTLEINLKDAQEEMDLTGASFVSRNLNLVPKILNLT